LPSITPSYLYTLVAMVAVCSLLVFSFMAYADTLRLFSETRHLKNLMDYVASKITELLALTFSTDVTAEAFLPMPISLGNKQYWLLLRNDSTKAWVEGGLGNMLVEGTEMRVYLPNEAVATGSYIGGYGAVCLECYVSAGVPHIQLKSSTEGD